jgi:Fe/S biogenesis protein NfuA
MSSTDTTDPVESDADTSSGSSEIIAITPEAMAQISEIKSQEPDPEALRLRVEVTGTRGVDYTYDLAFETAEESDESDVTYFIDDITVVIPEDSIDNLDCSVLDLPASSAQGGLVLRNPNRPNPVAGKELDLSGELPDKVQQLLDQSINPALSAHGGFATLVGVEETKVYLAMGGGCQGCSLSQATMVDGITTAINESIPEVTEIVDVTDHTAGDNPFYT